jgi:hypothetical protein
MTKSEGTDRDDLAARVLSLLASPAAAGAVVTKRPPSADPWPLEVPEPPDLAALYAVTDGIALADGTVILRRGELAATTAWLKQEKSLDDWPEDLVVIGERDDVVIVRDLDQAGARAGGGVLEAATDGLSTFKRAALGVVGYLEARLSPGGDTDKTPEALAREAAARKDAAGIEAAIARPFYPGAGRDLAHAALTLGAIRAAEGDAEGAMAAFDRSVVARVRSARRGAEEMEAKAAWRSCALAAEQAGAPDLAALIRSRSSGGGPARPAPPTRTE